MAVLSGDIIKRLVKEKKLFIEPFHESEVQPASYDLRLGHKSLISPKGDERGRAIDLQKEKDQILNILPGQFVAVLTEEKLSLPNNICGRFGLKSFWARKGLMAFGGIQVDPGFKGRLAISLFNVGPENIEIKYGEPLFTIEFTKLEQPTSMPYKGDYQNQEDFPAEQYDFIISAHTVSLAEIPDLRNQVKEINKRLEVVDDMYTDMGEIIEFIEEGQELSDKVAERLNSCVRRRGKEKDVREASDVAEKLGLDW